MSLAVVGVLLSFSAFSDARDVSLFNDGWKFRLEDRFEYKSSELDDSDWREVMLPHDWSIESAFSETNSGRNAWLPGGIAWYRKTFTLLESCKGKHIEIQFGGVYKNAAVWINNTHVGTQHDGYTSFFYDISELLYYGGKENVIAIQVDNSIQPNCRWYSGSGIYRNVHLKILEPTHVATWGTFITTPEVSKKRATVSVETTVENMDEAKELVLETIIYDAENRAVATTRSEVAASRFAKKTIQQELQVKRPNLWSVDTPYLYRAESVLKSGKVVLDRYPSTFGIRSIEFDADRGFFLNGENMKMKGVCLHHDAGSFGAAVPDASIWRYRLQKLKAMGCNAIRTAHNPASATFMDLCDEMGFLVMDEFVDKWDKTYRPSLAEDSPFYDVSFFDPNFSDEWKRNFESTILRDRNRPSVIMWSVGNENHPPESLGQKHGLRTYASFVRSLDPTRPVISGMERGKDYKGKNIVERKVNDIIDSCRYMDLIALNYGEQWCEMIGEKKPGKPFVGTESYRYFNSTLEVRFASVERSPWLDALENDNNMGVFLWPGIGYLGESKTFPNASGNSGLISSAEFRRHESYLYEAFWTEEPMVYLAIYEEDPDTVEGTWGTPKLSRNWNRIAGEATHAATYGNCDSVNLYLNGKLLGNQKLADVPNWIMKWRDIAYEEGTLTAKGVVDGVEVCASTVTTAGDVSRIRLTADAESLKSAGFIRVDLQLTDDAGRPVVFSEKELTFKISGDAEIFALNNGNGDVVNSRLNRTNRPTYLGRCLCLIKTGDDTGAFTLTVKGPGLEAAVLELEVAGTGNET